MRNIHLRKVNTKSDPIGDVVFLHGLGGNGDSTWRSSVQLQAVDQDTPHNAVSFFPSVLAADFPELDFYVLDYSAVISRWSEKLESNELTRVCNGILEFLIGKGIGKLPLVFVCHSLGGVVAKDLLRLSCESRNKRQCRVYNNTKAVSFIATPHKGSNWADVLNSINSVLRFIRTSERITELTFDNTYLELLSSWYRDNVSPEQIETQAFYEQKTTKGILVVPHMSANPDVRGCKPIPIDANHLDICKPTTKDDPVYVGLGGLVRFHLLEEKGIDRRGGAKAQLPPQTVVIGLCVRDDKVLMVRRRNPTDGLTWQFVAGRFNRYMDGEDDGDAFECIVREFMDETGVTVRAAEKLGTEVAPNIPWERIYVACEYLKGTPSLVDDKENSEVDWVPLRDVRRFITSELSKTANDYLGRFDSSFHNVQ